MHKYTWVLDLVSPEYNLVTHNRRHEKASNMTVVTLTDLQQGFGCLSIRRLMSFLAAGLFDRGRNICMGLPVS